MKWRLLFEATMFMRRFGKLRCCWRSTALPSRGRQCPQSIRCRHYSERCYCWPRAISAVYNLFLRRNSTLRCQVTGTRHYSVDLPQGGLEIPCRLIFSGHASLIAKVQKLLQEAITSGMLKPCNNDSVLQQQSLLKSLRTSAGSCKMVHLKNPG